eukprot:SAG31_NODE_642_length_13301_cov_14.143084_17_plen_40_part_00
MQDEQISLLQQQNEALKSNLSDKLVMAFAQAAKPNADSA